MDSTAGGAQAFRFLDLPAELRLLVYEHISIRTRHLEFRTGELENEANVRRKCTAKLVVQALPLAILRVCRLIQSEASAVLEEKLEQIVASAPKAIVSYSDITAMSSYEGVYLIFVLLGLVEEVAHRKPRVGCDFEGMLQSLKDGMSLKDRDMLLKFIHHARLYYHKTYTSPIQNLPLKDSGGSSIYPATGDFQIAVTDSYNWDGNKNRKWFWLLPTENDGLYIEVCALERDLRLTQAEKDAAELRPGERGKLGFQESIEMLRRNGARSGRPKRWILPPLALSEKQWKEEWMEGENA